MAAVSGCTSSRHKPTTRPDRTIVDLMHRYPTNNKCYTKFKDFSRSILTFLRERGPRYWHVYCDEVINNFSAIDPTDFRTLA